MRVPRVIGAIVFVVAQGSCLDSCKDGCEMWTQNSSSIVESGETRTVHLQACSTCGHSDVPTTWQYLGTPDAGGSIIVALEYFCSNGQGGTYNMLRSAQVPETRLDYHEVGVKNVCGEDQDFTLYVRVTNQASVSIEATSTVACPKIEQSSGSPAAPSPASGRAGRSK